MDALVREEVNSIDKSDLFLDVFVTDDFNHIGGLDDYETVDAANAADATDDPKGPVALAQSPMVKFQQANRMLGPKARFAR